MDKHEKQLQLRSQLQDLMHRHGLKAFVDALSQAAYYAGDDMQDINKQVSDNYSEFANQLIDFSEEFLPE